MDKTFTQPFVVLVSREKIRPVIFATATNLTGCQTWPPLSHVSFAFYFFIIVKKTIMKGSDVA